MDSRRDARGKLKIGDDWNAIRIIALSQSNPLKAVAEFVENSIDAHAKSITITRVRERGAHYLAIKDDGDGVPRDADGLPDFKYVATHICDSIKRRLKADGSGAGLPGEFGIGLFSFWTVGDTLTLTSTGADQRAPQYHRREQRPPRFRVRHAQSLLAAALPGALVRQGAGAQEFRGTAFRSAARAHGRAVVARRGQSQVPLMRQAGRKAAPPSLGAIRQ
jgi:hypothetical protein